MSAATALHESPSPRLERSFVDDALAAATWDAAGALADEAAALEVSAENPSAALREMVALYGRRGLLRLVTDAAHGGEDHGALGVCLVRERLGYASPLCELAFAMQGLGSHPLTLAGGPCADEWLARVVRGDAVAAFALTEANAGTDLGGIGTTARREGGDYVLDGEKVTISNAGVADYYVVFAVSEPDAPASRRLSAFVVPAAAEGVTADPTAVLGGHPIGTVRMSGARIPESHLLGEAGRGLGLALATLHRYRPTVGAAAVGFAARALDESLAYTRTREQFGAPLSDLPLVQARLAEMACEIDAARLLVHRAAVAIDRDEPRGDVALKGSMAKLVATEAAQRVIDSAVQLHGGKGVTHGQVVCRLYEDVRALRIYEGTNDVQKLLIARELLR